MDRVSVIKNSLVQQLKETRHIDDILWEHIHMDETFQDVCTIPQYVLHNEQTVFFKFQT